MIKKKLIKYFYYIWDMKSLFRLSAIFTLLCLLALSCPANATNTEETKTFEVLSTDNTPLEVADFSTFLIKKSELNKNYKDAFVEISSLQVNSSILSANVIDICKLKFTEIKRFPNARDSLTYAAE